MYPFDKMFPPYYNYLYVKQWISVSWPNALVPIYITEAKTILRSQKMFFIVEGTQCSGRPVAQAASGLPADKLLFPRLEDASQGRHKTIVNQH